MVSSFVGFVVTASGKTICSKYCTSCRIVSTSQHSVSVGLLFRLEHILQVVEFFLKHMGDNNDVQIYQAGIIEPSALAV